MLCFIAMAIAYITCSCYLGLIDRPIVVPEGMCSLGYEEYNKGQASDKSGLLKVDLIGLDWFWFLQMFMDYL